MNTVVIAEDHHIVRQGLKFVLATEKSLQVIGEAADGMEAVEVAVAKKPDVLLLDLMIPRLHGLDVIRQVRAASRGTRVIVLSSHKEEPYVREALRNGASAYVLKDCTATDLVHAIREVLAGRRYLSSALSDLALPGRGTAKGAAEPDSYDLLTNRERHVLQCCAEGLTSQAIARQLFISPRTAETHRSNLMRKLGLRSQTDLVRFAIRKGIISA